MSLRIRGQEISLRIAVDGKVQEGSFFKVKDFKITPRQDLTETDYVGEDESDIDFQHHGFDFSFSIDNQDQKALDFLSQIIDRELQHTSHPNITFTVLYAYREPGASDQAEVYHDVFMKVGETGFQGRKEYVSTSFEGKCKKRSQIAVA